MKWFQQSAKNLNQAVAADAQERQNQLTKPAGSLGQLESLAISLSAMQGNVKPNVDKVHIAIFAGDHGVADEGVSAFPQAVTAEMIRNFARGGAAISVLAKQLGATLSVINTGTVNELEVLAGVKQQRVANGTQNFAKNSAMTAEQCEQALALGKAEVEIAIQNSAQLFIAGDMGIANTTSATALACYLLKMKAQDVAGPGTGLDKQGIERKARVIQGALEKYQSETPFEALCNVGGFEIVAMVGAYIAAAQQGLPVLVDGFITSVSAMYAQVLCPTSRDWMIFAHQSAEPAHRVILNYLDAKPLVSLGMRLGEGSGAAVAVPLLRLACSLQNNMATFAEAMVSNK